MQVTTNSTTKTISSTSLLKTVGAKNRKVLKQVEQIILAYYDVQTVGMLTPEAKAELLYLAVLKVNLFKQPLFEFLSNEYNVPTCDIWNQANDVLQNCKYSKSYNLKIYKMHITFLQLNQSNEQQHQQIA